MIEHPSAALSRRQAMQWSAGLLIYLLLYLVTFTATAQEPSPARLEKADSEPQNWLTYGSNYRAWRHSALAQITRENVSRLTPVWAFQTGELRGGLNATPLVMDGVMYLVGPMNRVFAINAATGSASSASDATRTRRRSEFMTRQHCRQFRGRFSGLRLRGLNGSALQPCLPITARDTRTSSCLTW